VPSGKNHRAGPPELEGKATSETGFGQNHGFGKSLAQGGLAQLGGSWARDRPFAHGEVGWTPCEVPAEAVIARVLTEGLPGAGRLSWRAPS